MGGLVWASKADNGRRLEEVRATTGLHLKSAIQRPLGRIARAVLAGDGGAREALGA